MVLSYALPSRPSYRGYSEGMNGNRRFQYPNPKDAVFSDAQRNGVYGESIPFAEALEEAETMSNPESDSIYGESIPFPEALETMSDPKSDWIYEEDEVIDQESALAESFSTVDNIPVPTGDIVYVEKHCTYKLKRNPVATAKPTGCDSSYRPQPNDYISQRFFDAHICVHHGTPPDLKTFCAKFRPEIDLYTVLVVTPRELGILRDDIRANQQLYAENMAGFPPTLPPPSTVHFYTNETFLLFYQCEKVKGAWKAKQLSNRYQVFVPWGAAQPYQIYHGCAPSTTRPENGVAPGPC